MLNPDVAGDLVECIKRPAPITISDYIPIAVAYRSSDYVASLLGLAGIPGLNLTDIGCPRVEAIRIPQLPEPDQCGHNDSFQCAH